jgi:hypothetical protein
MPLIKIGEDNQTSGLSLSNEPSSALGGLRYNTKSTKTSGDLDSVDGLLKLAASRGLLPEANEEAQTQPKLSAIERLSAGLGAFNPAEAIMRQQDNTQSFLLAYPTTIVQGVASALTGNDYGEQTKRRYFQDIAANLGIENNIARFGVGFVGDVLLDPTTYFGGAMARIAGVGIKQAAKTGVKMVGKVSPELETALTKSGTAVKDALGDLFTPDYKTTEGLGDALRGVKAGDEKILIGLSKSNMSRLGNDILTDDQHLQFAETFFIGKNAELKYVRDTEKTMIDAFNEAHPDAKALLKDPEGAVRRLEYLATSVPKKITKLTELRQRLAQPFMAEDLIGLKTTISELRQAIADLLPKAEKDVAGKAKEFIATGDQIDSALLSALSTEKQTYREMITRLQAKLTALETGVIDPVTAAAKKQIATDSSRYSADEILRMSMRNMDPKYAIREKIAEIDKLIRDTTNDMFTKQGMLENVLQAKSIAKDKINKAFATGDFSTLLEELVLALKPAIKAAGFSSIKVAEGSLSVEARGFKTAEEFLEAQGKVDNDLEGIYNKIYGKDTDQFGQSAGSLAGKEVGGSLQGGKIGNLQKDSRPNLGGIVKHISENPDGFTLNLNGKPVTRGFAVSPYKGREMIIDVLDESSVEKFIDKNIDLLLQKGNHFGGWRNTADGKYYLDVSVVNNTLEEGMSVAAHNNQIAIYDIAGKQEVRTADFLKSKLADVWNKAKQGGTMKVGSFTDDKKLEEVILAQIKRNDEMARKAGIEDPFKMYFPSLDKNRLNKFMMATRSLRIGSEDWRKEYKNLIKDEDLLRNPVQAYFKVESEAALNNYHRGVMANVVEEFGMPVNAFKNEAAAKAAGYKMWREKGTIMGKEIGWLPERDWKMVNGMMGSNYGAIDALAKNTGFDAATSLFKRAVTGLFAPFHVRNFVSGVIQNYEILGSASLKPSNIALGQRIATKMSKGAWKGFGDDRAVARVVGKHAKSFDKETVQLKGKTWYIDDIMQAVEKKFGGSTRYVADFNSITSDAKLIQDGAVFSKERIATMTKRITDRKRWGAGQIEGLLSQESPHFKAAQVIGGWTELQQKATAVVTALDQGHTLEDALKLAEKAGFDYSKLTEFESKIMRRIIPFYSFTKKNIELQLSTLKNSPQRINQVIRSIDNLSAMWESNMTDQEKKNLPAYLREYLSVPVGRSNEGVLQFVRTFGTPIEAFTELFREQAEGKSSIERTFLATLSKVNPYLKVPIEMGIGQDSFRMKDINEVYTATEYQDAPGFLKDFLRLEEVQKKSATGQTYTQYVADPERLLVARSLFTSRGFTYFNNIFNGDAPGFFKVLDAASGIKTADVDTVRQEGYTERWKEEALGDLLRRHGVVSEFNKLFIPKNQ